MPSLRLCGRRERSTGTCRFSPDCPEGDSLGSWAWPPRELGSAKCYDIRLQGRPSSNFEMLAVQPGRTPRCTYDKCPADVAFSIFCSIKNVPDPILSGAIAWFLRSLCVVALSQPRDSSVSASHCSRDVEVRSRSVAILSREQLFDHCRSATASITSRLQPRNRSFFLALG